MFPLGSVLFPGFGLPLHVFEPRYRFMIESLLGQSLQESPDESSGAEFGVVLIERGSEVGGDDHRFNVGTIARIIAAEQFPDGRWFVQVTGTQRFRVVEWLPDAPYPQAMVNLLPDVRGAASGTELVQRIDLVIRDLRGVLALAAEVGVSAAPATIELDDDPSIRLWQACGLAPIGQMDDLTLLSAETMTDRVDLLRGYLEDARVVLSNRLVGG